MVRALWVGGDRSAFDLHVHTTASDGVFSPKALVKVLEKKEIGCAVTDHNIISGVREALSYSKNIVPGIEISAREGPHLLAYFDRFSALEEYYNKTIAGKLNACPHLAVNLSTMQIIESVKDAGGLIIAAHPYGYGIAVRGVLKGVETKVLEPAAAEAIDGVEVLCSGLAEKYNLRAEEYARIHNCCVTGGSDAHTSWDVGLSVTLGSKDCGPAGLLEEIRAKKVDVSGMERAALRNSVMGLCMTPGYVPYLGPLLYTHAKQHVLRLKQIRK